MSQVVHFEKLLIEAVRPFPPIYSVGDDTYMARNIKAKLWEKVSVEVGGRPVKGV